MKNMISFSFFMAQEWEISTPMTAQCHSFCALHCAMFLETCKGWQSCTHKIRLLQWGKEANAHKVVNMKQYTLKQQRKW
jgi:hypothetical protein